jgi:DNA-binding transcriptional ArsR family regulator
VEAKDQRDDRDLVAEERSGPRDYGNPQVAVPPQRSVRYERDTSKLSLHITTGQGYAHRVRTDREEKTVRISDVRGIRALAHPARLAIIDALYLGRTELTATECAELTGLSPSAMSYHLRALERWGIVERAEPAEDGRERPWRAAGTRLSVHSDDPGATGPAEAALVDLALDRDRAAVRSFLARESDEPPEWRDALEINVAEPWLTVDELSGLLREFQEALEPFQERRLRENRPEGSRRVRVSIVATPLGSPPGANG